MTRILVVDDSPTQAQQLRLILEPEGFAVEVATTAERALELFGAAPFDLVLVAVLLPGLSGHELCRRIKTHPVRGRVPVILLTVLGGSADLLRGLECGAENYLIKPCPAQVLIARVRATLSGEARRAAGAALAAGATREQILTLLTSACEDVVRINRELRAREEQLAEAQARLERQARHLEARARSSEDKHRRLMEQANDAILLLDPSSRVLEANRRAEELLGLAAGAAVGRRYEEFVPREDLEEVRAQFRRLLAGGAARADNAHVRRVDGGTVPVDYAAALTDVGGERLILAILRDVSARRELEAQLRQAQKMEAVGRLAGGVAHDFNNLLTVILGYGQMLLGLLPARNPAREPVEQIVLAGERATALVRHLLAFSRKEAVQPRLLDLNAVIAGSLKLLRRLIGADVALETDLSAEAVRVKADAGQLEQVLMNLAVNASDAMLAGGRLMIRTRSAALDEAQVRTHPGARPGPHVLLEVSDTGSGMTPEVRERIFEPFFTTKEPGKGTGLGLATVYGIVQQSGGHVEVESAPGRGTRFRVYLPQASGPAEGPDEAAAVWAAPRGTETLLLAEDEAPVRTFARDALRTFGYTVLDAADGAEALRVAERHAGPIHLLLTDLIMPGLGGTRLAEALAASRPGVKVLYLSGYTADALARRGVLAGGEIHFLQKPFTPSALARKVREVLDQPPP
jgi:PAS domain S-box-containing protein